MPKTESRFVDFRAVKAAVTMEEVLTHYGILDRFKRGQDSLSGPCPIHQGTNPTQFRVSLSKNCWNCFGDCHGGGNVLDFVAKMEKVDPVAAANRLIDWFQLDRVQLNGARDNREPAAKSRRATPSEASTKDSPAGPDSTSLPRSSHQAVASTLPPVKEEPGVNKPLGFQLELDSSHPYLAERGLTSETIREFGLGYCGKGVMAQRIAIPIRNVTGELVGYAGRWPGEPPEARPKYRLPDGFRKSSEIYRLAEALQEPPEQPLVIVEGFFDVMKLWQIGVRKCGALMGSSLSVAQATLLAEHIKPSSHVLVMFDEDNAGREGRDDVVRRLALKSYVRVVAFAEEGFQPERLTAEEARLLGLTER